MDQRNKNKEIIYKKLVRDRIPEIIEKHGKTPFTRKIDGREFREAVGRKILEEAYELFSEWTKGDPELILKESADLLEITLAAINEHGFKLEDLLIKRQNLAKEQGGFKNKIFLENVGQSRRDDIETCETPAMFFSPDREHRLIDLVNRELEQSDSAWIASAFYTPGITNLLVSSFERFIDQGGSLRILLSTMGNITRPEYFSHLKEFVPGAKIKVFHPPGTPFEESPPNFHVKVYLFLHRSGTGAMLIGSSNFTEAGFTKNIEWNYFTPGEINLPFDNLSPFQAALEEFERYWKDASVDISDGFLAGYKKRWQPAFRPQVQAGWQIPEVPRPELFDSEKPWGKDEITPNDLQKEALDSLARMRKQSIARAAVIAATGVGKTYLAAFDFKQSGSKRLLYIAHRENILNKSMESFRSVLGDGMFGAVLGNGKMVSGDCTGVFAMIQTLSRESHLKAFTPEKFDYIVMDEFHHSEAATYRKVLSYFNPEFFLGLTATPERMDGRDVLAHCDYNIAYETRLLDAVDRGWLAPFQYFAVYDETDYSQITWRGTGYDEEELDRALIDDTRTEIIARNLKKFLPAKGKIKALAFCSSIAHARYTARHLTQDHGIESVALVGLSSETERQEAIDRLRSENDPLEVICSVDIFNEGIDIPEVTHVLFLRPTQSFTIFLQQLGRGLRKVPGKDFLVAIDFVGNFRKAHVAPLALSGYTSMQAYSEDYLTSRQMKPWQNLPKGCYLNTDLEVQRIWDQEIRKIVKEQISTEDRLKILYLEIKADLGDRSPSMMDFFASAYDVDPYVFIKKFGNWLRTRKYCGEDLPEFENSLLDTPGEAFLQHLEKELSPVRSYKMVVLLTLLDMDGTAWEIEDIAKGFLGYFLSHPDKIFDYDDLAKADAPDDFPLSRVITHIKKMPLHFLSNTENDYFILDADSGLFSLKPEIHNFWNDDRFKALVRERVEFTLARYFQRRRLSQIIYFDSAVLEDGFILDSNFSTSFLGEKPLFPGKKRAVKLLLNDEKFEAELKRSENGKEYRITYIADSGIRRKLSECIRPVPEKGERVFKINAEKESLRVEIIHKSADLRGIVVEIPYAVKKDSGYAGEFRRVFSKDPGNTSWRMTFDRGGYAGAMDVEIRDGDSFLAWTGSRYQDKTRFPARIKAAATALFAEGFRGEFHIVAKRLTVEISKKEN
ncbi:DEAD/DEAH box helicase family protein [Thermodesulfobacteriota bacterium]